MKIFQINFPTLNKIINKHVLIFNLHQNNKKKVEIGARRIPDYTELYDKIQKFKIKIIKKKITLSRNIL